MGKCQTCRKAEDELDSVWDKIRLFFFNFFHNDIIDLNQQKYTQGFADGYQKGCDHTKEANAKYLKDLFPLPEPQNKPTMLVNKEDVIYSQKDGTMILGGQIITEREFENLKAEVLTFKNFRLWKVFQETIKQLAINKSMLESKNFEEVLSGKLMLYNLDVIQSIVDVIDKKEVKKAPTQPKINL